MSRSLWSSAIYMAGRSSNGRVSKQRLVEAVGLWQQMEHIANIEADDVVFTILFEIAVKANQFVVAERLEQEMKRRGLRFERWGLVTKIFSYGVRKNAEGVRATFDEFVSSGELVDTVVLNCVMASFLRAGDTVTAKSIYAQMLEAQTAQKAAPSNPANLQDPLPSLAAEFPFYRSKTKQLGSMLKKSKHLRARLPAFHSALQDSLPMTPDTRTFYIWLQHCARRSGNLKMFMQVLEDMERSFAVPPRHMIYILLFEGFALHGRAHKTTPEWTRERLRLTWLGFIRAVRDSRARHLGLYRNAPTMTWDNPLRSASDLELDTEAEVATVNSSTKPGDLYVPLLSTLSEAPSAVEDPAKANESSMEPVNHGEQDLSYQEEELSEGSEFFTEDDFEYDEVSDASEIPENNDGPLETLENNFEVPELPTEQDMGSTRENVESPSSRLDNGVFVGRRISIAILQAFGTCCGPDEVMEAWLQLEELWPPSKRTALDMLIMREVVEDQMARKHR
ncbi:hypothetical protein N7468_005408 [Penicillium chermesinum]|uniref:Pentatricopeptide repeat protein n=1 Tax=Penicillium chermesinum TaxID=63820 RepID=A0A9W9P1L6_9EURO|nr:uncharacterized protein N7468_005408 [Penicillium chermesinum]KAJ5232452.1 hypothetical protein N7468_005408 [Penicillium chermesinum]